MHQLPDAVAAQFQRGNGGVGLERRGHSCRPGAPDGIFVEVKPPIKPLAPPDLTPPTKDLLNALNAHPERMPTLSVPKPAKIAILIPTNRNPMRRNAFQ